MLGLFLIFGLIEKEEFYNLQDSNGKSKISFWQLIKWIYNGKKYWPVKKEN